MDLQDQLRNLFPNHKLSENPVSEVKKTSLFHILKLLPFYVNMKREKVKPIL